MQNHKAAKHSQESANYAFSDTQDHRRQLVSVTLIDRKKSNTVSSDSMNN